jgi:hypothetical protein
MRNTNQHLPHYIPLFTIAPTKVEKGLPKSPSPGILTKSEEIPPRPPVSNVAQLSEGSATVMPKTIKERNAVLRRKMSMFKKTRSDQEVQALKIQLRMQARIRREQEHMFETTAAGERKVVIPRPPLPPE